MLEVVIKPQQPNQSSELRMSESEILANALSDPDNPPITEADFAHLKPLPLVRAVRLRLRLTQEEFAGRYHVSLGTLRDWEQRRTEPDRTARAYLKVIAAEPVRVAEVLARKALAPAC
jgi:putative transcriptional regulator